MENILRYESSEVKALLIRLAWGQLTVAQEGVEKLQVIATGDEGTVKELRLEMEDGKLTLEQPQYGLSMNINSSKWLEVVVRVPTGFKIDVDAQTITGGMNIRGLFGEDMRFETVTGNIYLENLKSKKTYIRTISADTRAEKISGEKLAVRTVSGAVLMEKLTFEKISCLSVSGKFTMGFDEPFDSAEYNTAAGDVSLYVPAEKLNINYKSIRGNLRTEGISQTGEGPMVKVTTVTGDASLVATQQ